jgi:hypothetical protein
MTVSTSTATDTSLLPTLQRVFPSVSSYQTLETINQASAIGYILKLSHNDSDHDAPTEIFLKQVLASRYVSTKKDWPDLRRSLLYARTEARFYQEFAPLLREKNQFTAIPKVYLAEYELTDWIAENETGHLHQADPSVVKEDLPDAEHRGGTVILECISPDRFYQESPLTIPQCHASLTAVAQLHAAAWQDVPLLEKAEQRLSLCSFHLSMRNPKELTGIIQAWDHFCSQFGNDLRMAGVWNDDSVANMGARVAAVAEYVSEQVSVAKACDPYATLVHGDYKSMNVFLPVAEKGRDSAVLVDFASVGVGLGVSDVAMHIHHAVLPQDLDTNGGEDGLLRHYWQTLQDCLTDGAAREAFTWEVALRQYQFAVVDYFRFFLGRFWRSSTPESMHKLRNNKNTNFINRSIPAAVAFVARVEKYLAVVEDEYNNNNNKKQQTGEL